MSTGWTGYLLFHVVGSWKHKWASKTDGCHFQPQYSASVNCCNIFKHFLNEIWLLVPNGASWDHMESSCLQEKSFCHWQGDYRAHHERNAGCFHQPGDWERLKKISGDFLRAFQRRALEIMQLKLSTAQPLPVSEQPVFYMIQKADYCWGVTGNSGCKC